MFLFLRLLLAHLIGDFPLQFNAVFAWKLKGFRHTIPHALIVTSCFIALSWPYLGMARMWFFIIFLGASHLVQDTVKVKFGSKSPFIGYVADQLSHIGLIACVFLTGMADAAPPAGSNLFIKMYNSDALVVFSIAFIAATYNGYFMIRCFKDSYLGRASYNAAEKWYGMFERGLLVTFFLLPTPVFFVMPALLLFRPLVAACADERHGLARDFVSLRETGLSWLAALIAVCAALYLRPVTR